MNQLPDKFFVLMHTHFITKASDTDILYKPYSMLVQERYKTELEFIENIRLGNRTAALKNWKSLHNSVDFLKKRIGYTLEGARISAAVTRTTIRLVGMEAGLPAELGDWLTSQSARISVTQRILNQLTKSMND